MTLVPRLVMAENNHRRDHLDELELPTSCRQGPKWGVMLNSKWTSEPDRPERKPQPCHVLAVGWWARYGTSLTLSFLGCKKKTGIIWVLLKQGKD